jgi:hypothetical protein
MLNIGFISEIFKSIKKRLYESPLIKKNIIEHLHWSKKYVAKLPGKPKAREAFHNPNKWLNIF